MVQESSLYRYVCVLMALRMFITLTPGGTGRREKVALQIQEVAPTDSRGGPHHVCGVALCSMWHFALRVDTGGSPTDSRGGPHRFKRWPPPCVWCGTLLCVALCSVWGMDSRGGPHHVCGVALYSVWHFALCEEWIQEMAPTMCMV